MKGHVRSIQRLVSMRMRGHDGLTEREENEMSGRSVWMTEKEVNGLLGAGGRE